MQNEDDNFEFDDDFIDDEFDDDLDLEIDDFEVNSNDPSSAPMPENYSQEQQQIQSQSLEKKKISLNFNTIVIIIAVILGGAVIYFKVIKGNNNVSNQPQKFVSSLGAEGATEHLTNDSNNDQETAIEQNSNVQDLDSGFLNDDMSVLPQDNNVEQVIEDLPMPTPISQQQEIEAVDDQVSVADNLEFFTEVEGDNDISETVNDVDDDKSLNDSSDNVVAVTDASKNNELSSASDGMYVDAADNGEQSPLLDINKKLDMFLTRMDGLEDKLNVIEDSSNQRIAMMEDSIKSLEKKIKSSKSLPKKPSVAIKPKAKKKVDNKKIEWQLKAAQPGKAWIAQKGKSSIKAVKVGDIIDGIGKVKSISQYGNSWVIVGSYGQIRQ